MLILHSLSIKIKTHLNLKKITTIVIAIFSPVDRAFLYQLLIGKGLRNSISSEDESLVDVFFDLNILLRCRYDPLQVVLAKTYAHLSLFCAQKEKRQIEACG